MKTKTIKLMLSGILVINSLILFAQNHAIEFTYDAAGNRTERHVIELKSPENSQEQNVKSGEQKSGNDVVFTEQLGEQEISIFPNPTKGELSVKITNLKLVSMARIELYTLAGELLLASMLEAETVIDLSAMDNGTYILKILLDDRVSTWKVVKE